MVVIEFIRGVLSARDGGLFFARRPTSIACPPPALPAPARADTLRLFANGDAYAGDDAITEAHVGGRVQAAACRDGEGSRDEGPAMHFRGRCQRPADRLCPHGWRLRA